MNAAGLVRLFPDLSTNDAIKLLAHARFHRVNRKTLVDQLHCVRSDMVLSPGANFLELARRAIEGESVGRDRQYISLDEGLTDSIQYQIYLESDEEMTDDEREDDDVWVAAQRAMRPEKFARLIADPSLKKTFINMLIRLRDGEFRKNDFARWMPEVLKMREEGVLR
jgi:hypothetical protein